MVSNNAVSPTVSLVFAAGYVFVPYVHCAIVVAFAVVAEADLFDGVFELAEEDATPWTFTSFLAGEEVVAVS